MPREKALAVLYTRSVLGVSLLSIRTPYSASEWPEDIIHDFGLGADARHHNPGDEYYWEAVRRRIMEIPVSYAYQLPITKAILLGESTRDGYFLRVLEEAVGSHQDEMPVIVKGHEVFAAAMGAAMIAKRFPFGFEHMYGDEQGLHDL